MDHQIPQDDDFIAECEAFCAAHKIALSTLSQRALKQPSAIGRLPKMKVRVAERMARVRSVMAEIKASRENRK